MFTNGNGIYIYNIILKTYKFYCYISNLDDKDYKELKENEIFITYFNGEIIEHKKSSI